MPRILWFKDISKDDGAVVGGKGANLGEMFNAGFPVPPGFVVTAQTFKEFIEATGIKNRIYEMLSKTDVENTGQLQNNANEIQKLIIATDVPKNIAQEIIDAYEMLSVPDETSTQELLKSKSDDVFVAVRSSATAEDLPEASFAGQQATFLNVKGNDQLIKAVRACWASLFTARAIYYREKNNFPHEKVLIADVVQRMVNSEVAGVIFSMNPATNKMDEIIIEAAYGLGEYVVSGTVNPDLYIVDKKTFGIKDIKINKQDYALFRDYGTGRTIKQELQSNQKKAQKLNEFQVIELAKLAKKLEEHYNNMPQDSEWAIEKGKIYLVQTRAVTTIKKVSDEIKAEKEEVKEDVEEEAIARQDTAKHKVLVTGLTASPGVASGKVSIVHDMNELNKIEKGDVMVTKMTNPDMVPAMKKAIAIVTDEGGLTCHAAIVSREMGIPCIVGTEKATQILKEGSIVTVDASHGTVFEGKISYEKRKEVHEVHECHEIVTGTEVKVIADLPDYAEKAAATGADGVGLVRIEFMIAEGGVHPAKYIRDNKDDDYTNMLYEGLKGIARAFTGKPVWVRTSDIRTDEYKNLKGAEEEPKETDPMIGWHGIRRGLDEPRILKAELKAIKKVHDEGFTNVGIMIPFVINVDELRKSKDIAREIGFQPCKDVEFGVMVETPAACWVIEDLCREGIDFISFGTNDLTQLTLGIDRNNERIAHLFSEMHPAVLGEIEKVVKVCKKYHVTTSICGQAGSNPKMAEFLVKIGIDSISANADAVHTIREVVAKTEKKLLLDAERTRTERSEG